MIGIFGGDDLFCVSGVTFAVGLRRRLSRQRGASSDKIDPVQVLYKLDDIATNAAATTVEDLFLRVDTESIVARISDKGLRIPHYLVV